mmetsp:Transcript_72724/g.204190  ORF Transcript_72724/g.204190 Transcript_72724/m.204190 type:complete len:345 (-) Transcript_72724:272-1306(-)
MGNAMCARSGLLLRQGSACPKPRTGPHRGDEAMQCADIRHMGAARLFLQDQAQGRTKAVLTSARNPQVPVQQGRLCLLRRQRRPGRTPALLAGVRLNRGISARWLGREPGPCRGLRRHDRRHAVGQRGPRAAIPRELALYFTLRAGTSSNARRYLLHDLRHGAARNGGADHAAQVVIKKLCRRDLSPLRGDLEGDEDLALRLPHGEQTHLELLAGRRRRDASHHASGGGGCRAFALHGRHHRPEAVKVVRGCKHVLRRNIDRSAPQCAFQLLAHVSEPRCLARRCDFHGAESVRRFVQQARERLALLNQDGLEVPTDGVDDEHAQDRRKEQHRGLWTARLLRVQ